jgi:fructokinase
VLAVGDNDLSIIKRVQIPTTYPKETLARCINFFSENMVDALGVGSFGPIDVAEDSDTYGQILATPKPEWQGTNILHELTKALKIPISVTTDVNASAYGEYIVGGGKNVSSLVYFTIGTGIGGGAIQDDQFIGGIGHAEMGHGFVMPRSDDGFSGSCPFHKNHCYEGLASGPTIEGRLGIPGQMVPRTDKVFDLISYYVSQMLFNCYLSLRPQKIILGGSVLSETELPRIQKYFAQFNHDYVVTPPLSDMIVTSKMVDNSSATIGNFALAKKQYSTV